jgi:exosortase D (VPLPA-CTERM-specific)
MNKSTLSRLALLTVTVGLLSFLYYDGLFMMVRGWLGKDDYSHGMLIPLVSVYLAWQRADELTETRGRDTWPGPIIVLLALFGLVLGEISTIFTVIQYAFVLMVYGVVVSFLGWRNAMKLKGPLLLLLLMVPLPEFLYRNLSASLQLISSAIGVWLIRLFGISVYLEGNVIDLGSYKLQVVDACSGLRYLFPLLALGFIIASITHIAFWKRAVLVLSTIPIAILTNSFRIGIIGVMVEYWGQSMAEGFLHDFEGWAIFMTSFAILMLELWILSRIGAKPASLRDVFFPASPAASAISAGYTPVSGFAGGALVSALLIALTVYPITMLPKRAEVVPSRASLIDFPMDIGEWQGRRSALEDIYIQTLKFDDYLLADFHRQGREPINFYVAYYGSQRKGRAVHSPRTCIPGGGWEIAELSQEEIPSIGKDAASLAVNRALIKNGVDKQVVVYWFQQRGRIITNEYLVKWFIFWDTLWLGRSDGALVRITTPLKEGEDMQTAEARIREFTQQAAPFLGKYIPS